MIVFDILGAVKLIAEICFYRPTFPVRHLRIMEPRDLPKVTELISS